jgi:FAD/FMN-containing dehydrogenase
MTIVQASRSTSRPPTDLDGLRRRVAGEVITAASASYDEARQVHDIAVDRRPAVILRAANAQDVSEGVKFAREQGLPLAVRSGGHSIAHHSMIDGGLVIDLSAMRGVSVDPGQGTARVQPGATSGDLAGPAHAYGLALSTGDTSTVGIGGLTTGGGIGFMVRKFGLAIDNLLSARVVTAAGDLLTASPTENQDLFWAIRGGGGNFGIITEFEFRLAPVGQVLGGALLLPATREVIRGYLDYVATAPDDLTTITNLMLAPPAPFVPEDRVGEPILMILPVWTGSMEDGEAAMAPLRALAEPVADLVSPIPYPAMYEFTAPAAAPHAASVRSMYANELSDDVIDSLLDAIRNASSPMNLIQLRGLGGAMARVSDAETAFAHRDKRYLVLIVGIWLDASEDGTPHRVWTEAIWEKIRPEGEGVYVNFLEAEGEDRVRDAYPSATYARLAEVKRKYDPTNLFRFNQNIRTER